MIAHIAIVGDHTTRVGAMIRFSQAETSQPFTRCKFGKVFLALLLGPEFVNWIHHKRALNGGGRTHTRITPFNFLHDDPVRDVIQSSTSVGVWNCRTKSTDFTKFPYDLIRKMSALGP